MKTFPLPVSCLPSPAMLDDMANKIFVSCLTGESFHVECQYSANAKLEIAGSAITKDERFWRSSHDYYGIGFHGNNRFFQRARLPKTGYAYDVLIDGHIKENIRRNTFGKPKLDLIRASLNRFVKAWKATLLVAADGCAVSQFRDYDPINFEHVKTAALSLAYDDCNENDIIASQLIALYAGMLKGNEL